MEIVIKPVCSRSDLRKFIHLPAKIHKGHLNWIPPLYSDEWEFFNAEKNKSYEYSDVILLLAFKGNKVVGRVMGIINYKYNDIHHQKHARFNFLETWDDREVIQALLEHVEEWARIKGMKKLVGPLAFSDKDPQGYLIHGFDEPIVIASHCNYEYVVDHLVALGFEKDIDLVVYKIKIPEKTPELYSKVTERALRNNPGIELLEFTRRKDLKPWIRPIFTLINDTFTEIYGFMPFTLEEMDDFANRYLLIMDPRLIKVIVNEKGESVAFVIGMPDISRGIKKSRGYLIPIGILHILLAGRRTKQLNLLLGAVHPAYQNRGLVTIMGSAILDSARKQKMEYIDSHLEMESNSKVRAEMEYMGGVVYKTYRIFGKPIAKIANKGAMDAS
jgi:GNAT superfamily N-acetyltransferase/ribosomal protein S18 acetylase RimI-like enzyme